MSQNIHVQLLFDEKAQRFDCYNRLDEVIAHLVNGDVFTIDHLNTTVLGTIKYSHDRLPYGFYFVSNDGQLTVDLKDGMKGYIEIEDRVKLID